MGQRTAADGSATEVQITTADRRLAGTHAAWENSQPFPIIIPG